MMTKPTAARFVSPAVVGRMRAVVLPACVLLLLFVRCSDERNPFGEVSLARARISSATFASGDTVGIFCRETLDVEIAVRELVDSIVLSVEGNRLFRGDSTLVSGEETDARYRFVVSFCDTGRQDITVSTFRGAEQVRDAWHVYVRAALRQDTVNGVYDDTVRLSTPAVGDDDVLYHWDFGYGVPVESAYPETSVVINDVANATHGLLWVTDLDGGHASPPVMFAYVFTDSRGPSIVCVNEGYEGRDTVYTGSETFFLKFHITDRGKGGVYSARVDNKAFDITQDPLFVKILYDVDTLTAFLPVTVRAVDNIESGNETEKRFFVGYDPDMGGGGGAGISVLIPSRDSTINATRRRYVLCMIENYTGDSLVVGATVNASALTADTLGDYFTAQWGAPVYLDEAVNTIGVTASTLGGSAVAETSFVMFFDSLELDTLAPTIFEISVGGQAAGGLYVPADTATVRIIAFDEGSGVASLTVNGTSRQPLAGYGGCVWDVPLVLAHGAAGNPVRIIAADAVGKQADTTVTIFRNSAPELAVGANPPYPLVVGELYQDTLVATDADADAVSFRKADGPDGLAVGSGGAISWTPAVSDTGTKRVSIVYEDQIFTKSHSFEVTVVDSSYYSTTVAFTVSEQGFPVYMEAESDTARVTLSIQASTDTGPFAMRAIRRIGTSQEEIPVRSGVFEWAPGVADTGYQRFVITVTDRYERADTLYPIILVVPQNRQFSLSYSFSGDTLVDGTLDFTQSTSPESLSFTIDDPDRVDIERYDVTISYAGTDDIRTIEGANTFVVVIDPTQAAGSTGTVTVEVVDKGGHTGTAVVQARFSP